MKKLILALSLFVMASCTCNNDVELEGTTWKLVELNGYSNPVLFETDTDILTYGEIVQVQQIHKMF